MKKLLTAYFVFLLLLPAMGVLFWGAPLQWPFSVLLYTIGLLSVATMTECFQKRVLLFIAIFFPLYLIECAYGVSYYIQGDGFNPAFFYHLDSSLFYSGIKEHLSLVFIVVASIAFWTSFAILLIRSSHRRRPSRLLIFVIVVFGLWLSPSLSSLASYIDQEYFNYAENLKDLVEEDSYRIVSAPSEKLNVVVIYAESLERTYFDEDVFPELLPSLTKLKSRAIDFTGISMGPRTGWTIAGIVGSQCGYPLAGPYGVLDTLGPELGNNAGFAGAFMPMAQCLGDVLKGQGYSNVFIGGADLRFAGKGVFLRSHGYDEVLGRGDVLENSSDPSYRNVWGAYDDTLFNKAYEKFIQLSHSNQPFNLTLLTLDTHHPNGFMSKDCIEYGDGENPMLNSVHCSDQIVSSFVDRIRGSEYSEKTIIVVQSDHLAMKNSASDLLNESVYPRKMTMVINFPDGRGGEISNPGLTFDIPATILDSMGFESLGTMGFGRSLFNGKGYLLNKYGTGWRDQIPGIVEVAKRQWRNDDVSINSKGIRFDVLSLSVDIAGMEFSLNSNGNSGVLASSVFVFEKNDLRLKRVHLFPLDQEVGGGRWSDALFEDPDSLKLVISRAKNLKGFVADNIRDNQWAIFLGSPGARKVISGTLNYQTVIPLSLIDQVRFESHEEDVYEQRRRAIQRNVRVN